MNTPHTVRRIVRLVAGLGLSAALVAGVAGPASAAPDQIVDINQPICGASVTLTGIGLRATAQEKTVTQGRGEYRSQHRVLTGWKTELWSNGDFIVQCMAKPQLVWFIDGVQAETQRISRVHFGGYHFDKTVNDSPNSRVHTLQVGVRDGSGPIQAWSPAFTVYNNNYFL